MTTLRNIVLLCLTSISFSLPINAAAQTLDFSKAWFTPHLTQNKDAVCASILAQAQQDFFFPPAIQRDKEPIRNNPQWILQNPPKEGLVVIDSNNKVYARGFIGRGCGGACESEYHGLSLAPFPETNSYGEGISFSSNQLTAEVPAYSANSGLYKHQNGSYYAISKGEIINVYKPLSNATWDRVCSVATIPNEESYKKISAIYNSISELTKKVNVLMGEEGYTCGSMRTLSRWKQFVREALIMTMYRPWALNESETSDSTYTIDYSNLESWSLQDIFQNLAFDEYKNQLATTTRDLSLFYQETYQWTQLQSYDLANKALKTAISSGIRFYRYKQPNQHQKALITAITDKQPLSVITPLVEAPGALKDINLSVAITAPQALDLLLTKGGSPNQQNEFNKTLLMYAAQYNQLESAKTLLNKGANPNLFTIIPEDTCSFTLSKSNMTALHYAVRYASIEVIKLLLNSGANPFAKTSERTGGRPIDWLHTYTADNAPEKNVNLTKDNVAELEKLLSIPSTDEVARRVLKFNLAAEQAFQKDNLDDAYANSALALGLDDSNERALANLSLILIKQGKPKEALESSNKLITKGKDANQIANAWFNYGLICEKLNDNYVSYNGNRYCRDGTVHPFLASFKAKPTTARANKIINLIKANPNGSCEFSSEQHGLIRLIQQCSDNDRHFCVLHSPQKTVTDQSFSFLKLAREKPDDLNSPLKISAVKPAKIVESFSIGGYQLTKLARDYSDEAVQFGDNICTQSSGLLPAAKYP